MEKGVMNQAELFLEDPPAPEIEHGGYLPPALHIYRGHELSTTYMVLHGMTKWRVPTLFWLMDLIIEALQAGPVHWHNLCRTFNVPVDTDTLSRHLTLMETRGLIHAEPVYYGSSSPHLGNYRGFQYRYSLTGNR
tara:strand:+ start:3910 stop:4314 length:405 start_codon:yes stop_codon:yes gene_type:complete